MFLLGVQKMGGLATSGEYFIMVCISQGGCGMFGFYLGRKVIMDDM